MTLNEIKAAVESGKTVHWASRNYVVIRDSLGQWLIKYLFDGHCIGLTWRDGVTMNGRPEEFFTNENNMPAVPANHRSDG